MHIALDQISTVGENLARPECVLTTSGGYLYTSDWRGGVSIIAPDGRQKSILATDSSFQPKPNGIALLDNGDFLLCHLGDEEGGVFRLAPDGELTPYLTEVEGTPLPPTNYAHVDHLGRVWVTVSTRICPRDQAYRPGKGDGFIVLVDQSGARCVADDLGYTNECCISPDGQYLYVNETFDRKLSRFKVSESGVLSHKEVIAEFGTGTYPDGLTFDTEGCVWITSIVSNRVIRISPNGEQTVIIEDVDPRHVEWTEAAYQSRTLGRPHLDNAQSEKLLNISSLAFGGEDMKTAYLGCLLGDSLYAFPSPVAGWKPPHWNFPNPMLK